MDEKVSPLPVALRGVKFTPVQAMRLAIHEARQGLSFVSPNPAVGCVVLDSSGGFLSAGHHEKYGEAHAEVNALRGLSKDELSKAQVFVTLEPCAHQGKTPSCARMMAGLPLGRVYFGLIDPNPLVSGKGAQILRDAGIPCELFSAAFGAELEDELEESCEAFLWNQRHGKVFVSLKVGSSLDGKIALASGESKWITGPESREYVHELRSQYDAVLIGVATLLKDNPSLDVRHPRIKKANKVVVLDSEGRGLAQSETLNLFRAHAASDLFWIVGKETSLAAAPVGLRASAAPRSRHTQGLEPAAVLESLWQQGIRSVMIEGGARVAGSFLQAGLVNRLHLFQAPVILGSAGALSWSEGFSVEKMTGRLELQGVRTQAFGRDVYLSGRLKNS